MGSKPSGVLLVERSNRVLAIDSSACLVLELSPQDVLGQKLDNVSEDLVHLPTEAVISQFAPDGTPYSIAKIETEKGYAVGVWLNPQGQP